MKLFVSKLQRLVDPIERKRAAEHFSSVISWSTLANIGRSRAMRLTVLAPLLGTFILFNQNTVGLFTFSADFLRDMGFKGSDGNGSSVEIFTLGSLYYLYFGLCFLGVGSFLFNTYCPDQIKDEPYIMSYISKVDLASNMVVAKSNLQFVLDRYFRNMRDVESDNPPPSTSFPGEIEVDFYNLIFEMFNDTEFTEVQNKPADAQNSQASTDGESTIEIDEGDRSWNDFMSGFYMGSGYPDIHEIARTVWSNPRVVWAFTMPFKGLSVKFSRDIAYVMFKILNHERYYVRICVAALYSIGFLLLLKPTVETFIRLITNMLY